MVRRTLRKLKREWDNAESPQPGLEPIIGNIYGSPPIDPRDCESYPDSPWCGGNPISRQPISANLSMVRDECNFGVQLDSTLGFIKMPPVQIVYRNPNCIPEPEEPPLEIPSENIRKPPEIINNTCGSIDYLHFVRYSYYCVDNETEEGRFYSEFTETVELVFFDFADNQQPLGYIKGLPYSYKATLYQEVTWIASELYMRKIWRHYSAMDENRSGTIDIYFNGYREIIWTDFTGNIIAADEQSFGYRWMTPKLIEIRGEIPQRYYDYKFTDFYEGGEETKIIIHYLRKLCPKIVLAPPLPPMSCCPNVRENDELLRLIAKRLGAYDYPVSVPRYLTDRSAGTETIENLTRFHSWLGKNLDALCGKFPIEIKIEDADIDQEGNQSQTVKIPNIAEALAEIVGSLLVLRSESDANLNATIRTLTEAGAAKQSAIIAGDYARGNAEFLGYKGNQVNRKVPFTFKPGEERLDNMLTNNYVEVKGWENEDSEDIKDIIYPLLEMAAAYRVANFRNVGTRATEGALSRILKAPSKYKGHIDTALEIAAIKKKNEKPPEAQKDSDLIKVPPDENRFDVFIEDAEKGFTNKSGITNTTEPYDRPFDERPRIREIGNNTAK